MDTPERASRIRALAPARRLTERSITDACRALMDGEADALGFAAPTPPAALFPGAFNPLHRGHRRIARLAARILGRTVGFELSLTNVDKPPIPPVEARRRLAQFPPDQPVWLTSAPTFVEKAALFPGTTFVVGADTIARVGDPRYYPSARGCDDALHALATLRCRFLVFGRWSAARERFETLGDLGLAPVLAALCDEVPEAHFRVDLSSSELRAARIDADRARGRT